MLEVDVAHHREVRRIFRLYVLDPGLDRRGVFTLTDVVDLILEGCQRIGAAKPDEDFEVGIPHRLHDGMA
jgi:hypothetical protein